MLAIFTLTLRALTRGRRLVLVGALLAVPPLLSVAFRTSISPTLRATYSADELFTRTVLPFLVGLFDQLVLPILVPLTVLIFATSALGDEVEDRTLVYLMLRPVSRPAIVLAKLAAATAIILVLVEVSLVVTYLIAAQGASELSGLGPILSAGLGGSVAYASLFLFVGVLMPRRALLVGFLYVLIWEGIAGNVSAALATLTVRRYVEGVLQAGLPLPTTSAARFVLPGVDGLTSALVLLLIVVTGITLSTWSLRRLELP